MTAATTELQPTAEQIATLDPDRDWDAADAAGVTYAHRRDHILTVACPEVRCTARAGEHCHSPNGWSPKGGFHTTRVDLAYGRTKPAKARKHRLTDTQAQWLEIAAETDDHLLYAPDQYAIGEGDARYRTTADAMERAGLIVKTGETPDVWNTERRFELTDEGWRLYWTHRLVIRRSTPPNHPTTCPCRTTRPEGLTS